METTTDLDQNDGFVDRYDPTNDRFRWKQPQIWIQMMVLWISMMHKPIGFDLDQNDDFVDRYDPTKEMSTDMDPKDGFADRYDAKTDRFRWKQPQIWIKTMILWIGMIQQTIGFDGNNHRFGSKLNTDMDPKDGFVDRYDAKSDRFRWK
eukprot:777933_1